LLVLAQPDHLVRLSGHRIHVLRSQIAQLTARRHATAWRHRHMCEKLTHGEQSELLPARALEIEACAERLKLHTHVDAAAAAAHSSHGLCVMFLNHHLGG